MSDTPPDLAALGNEPEIDAATLRDLREAGAQFQLGDIRDDWERAICTQWPAPNRP